MSADRFEIDPSTDQYGTERKSSPLKGCLIGCLIAAGVAVVLLLVAVWWIKNNWQRLAADFSEETIGQLIDESPWPDQEKDEVREQVARVIDAFRAGQLDGEDLKVIVEGLMDSPLITSMAVMAIDANYLKKSGLTEEEKSEGRVTLRRFMRGMIDKDIDEDAFDEVISHVADKGSDGEWQIRENVSDDDLRACLAAAKEKADAAEVAEEPEDVDPSDEIRKIIDKVLGEAQVLEEQPAPAE